ncbi:hypothetical protein [Neptuniibacter pectenicola]|jgi:hypothetical protein|uniref:hypothetical protein n=1 Tax=Neptuniibacter pectenicola TaxID=1806669 RepID=UPI0008301206|nr:hypothetical protein [Neptuniibacter pectenicola]
MSNERINPAVINVVDRYISVEIVKRFNSDAGWRGLGQYAESMGGGGCNSNGSMIYQLSMMFKEPDDPRTKWACAAMKLLGNKSESNHVALVAYVLLRNRPDPKREGSDHHTKERIAQIIGMKRRAFHDNLQAAAKYINELVELQRIAVDEWESEVA